MKRLVQVLAWLAVAMLVAWHLVPVAEEVHWSAARGEQWVSMFGWSAWSDLWQMIKMSPTLVSWDPAVWGKLMFASSFVSGVVGILGVAVMTRFAVPRMLRVAVAGVMTLVLAGGPGWLLCLYYAEPPDPGDSVVFPTFWLWPVAVASAWLAALIWAAMGKPAVLPPVADP